MTPLEAALAYASRGWRVVPIGAGQKHPDLPAWQDAATTDPLEIAKWYAERPARGVGVATGAASGVFVLDVDVPDGAESLAKLEAVHGPLPPTLEVVTGSGGRHLYFRMPPGTAFGNSAGLLGPYLDVRADGGQVLAPPTLHPRTGVAYEWEVASPEEPAEPPAWLVELLREEPKAERVSYTSGPICTESALARDAFNANPQSQLEVERLLTQAGWQEGRRDRQGVRYFTRPGKRLGDGHGATIGALENPNALRVFTPNAPPFEAERSYDPFDVVRLLAFGGSAEAAERALVEAGWGRPSDGSDLGRLGPVKSPVSAAEGLHLPEELWEARPALQHIRQAARSRLVAPDAVLGAVLTRIAACTPHTVELPPLVGEPMGLTFFAAPVGPPSAGKSAAAAVAHSLVPVPYGVKVLDRLPIGSGEGFVEALFEMRPDPDDEKGKRLVKVQTRHGAIFHIDEGTVLGDLANRSGSTIMPTLRSAFTHGTLGATNASAERKRLLHGTDYVYGVTMGIQPDKAGPLLGDAAAGTPQRFLWLMATDPGATAEPIPWPGALPWAPPSAIELEQLPVVTRVGLRRFVMPVDPAVVEDIRQGRVSDLRQERETDPGDEHRNLVQLKTAALLAILDRRLEVRPDDWVLARTITATSRAVRLAVIARLRGVERAKDDAYAAKLAHRELIVQGSKEAKALASGAGSAARHVVKHAAPEGCSRRCVRAAVAYKHRELVGFDAIVDEALRLEWITAEGDRFRAGRSRPS